MATGLVLLALLRNVLDVREVFIIIGAIAWIYVGENKEIK